MPSQMSTSTSILLKASSEVKWMFRYSMPKGGNIISMNGDGIYAWNDNITGFDGQSVKYIHGKVNYQLKVLSGKISENSADGAIVFNPENGELSLKPETIK